jgi:hypothetical protein
MAKGSTFTTSGDRDVSVNPTKEELEAARCWEADDVIPRRPAMTAFRQRTRLHQARWREAAGHPIGTQPYQPHPSRPPARPVGSRIPLAYGEETGANLITPAALVAAQDRKSRIERHQSFDHQRLWADLLSSEALAFNLFGDLAADPALADAAIHRWWPDTPGTVSAVRFAHSPGRLDPEYLNSLRDVDAAFILDHGDGTHGIVGIDVKYHERAKSETPKPQNLAIYTRVAERSGVFRRGAIDEVKGRSELAVMWLEHLLLLSMLQHASGTWTWARYVVVHPAGNIDIAELCARYRGLLRDPSAFDAVTLEDLLDAAALPPTTTAALRERYLPT